MQGDDRMIESLDGFVGKRVVVTRKMDGENTTLYSDFMHARSLDVAHHPSRHWVKQFWSSFAQDIPPGWRVVGENLYASHTIRYDNLASYFLGFHIWTDGNICLDWDATLGWFDAFGVTPVEVLFDGQYDERQIRSIEKQLSWDRDEGYVLRVAEAFHFEDYGRKVGKFVRQGHVLATTAHWSTQPLVRNGLLNCVD